MATKKKNNNWIAAATKNKGALRKKAGVKPGQKISPAKLKQLSKSKNPKTRKQANLAITLKKLNKKKGK